MLINESELLPLVRARDDLDNAIKALKEKEAILHKRRDVLQLAIDALRSGDDEIQRLLEGRSSRVSRVIVDETTLREAIIAELQGTRSMGLQDLCRRMEARNVPYTLPAMRRVLRGFTTVGKSVNTRYSLTTIESAG